MLVFSVVIISGLDNQNTEVPDVYNIFRPPYWCTTEAHQDDVFIRGRGGEWGSHMKQTGMLVVLIRSVNFRFRSRVGCSGKSANILCRQGLVQLSSKKHRITQREHGKKLGDICFKFFFFVPRPPKNDPKIAEKQQNFERKFKFRSIKSYFFKMYGWI